MSVSGSSDFVLLKRLWHQARPFWAQLAGMFLLGLLSAPLALLLPLPLKLAIDSVIGDHPLPEFLQSVVPGSVEKSKAAMLIFVVVFLIVLAGCVQLQSLASWLADTYVSEKLVLSFRARLFRHAQRLSMLYHERKGSADSIYRIQYDAPALQWILVHGIGPFINAVFTVAGMIYVTARINGRLALIALSVAPILFALSEIYRRRIRTRWSELKDVETSTLSVLEETLGAIRVVKAFGREERQQEHYVDKARHGVRRHIYLSFLDGSFGGLVGVTIACGTAATLFVGVNSVQNGLLTIGQLIIVMTYISQLYGPMKTISSQIGQTESSMASAERAFALLDETPDVNDPPNGRRLQKAEGAVEFRDVSFAYEPGRPVLHDIAFAIPAGARVGITGETGAGKTTLVSLLARFYDPSHGAVLLDGVNLREYRLADLRDQFAIVLQEPVLFSNSIAENIAYARPEATEEEIVAAAKAANAHDFIAALPDGYATLVGQRGARLSGGERQRISLARAFLKDAAILVLDEPTSSVDLKTEAIIMEAMERLMRDRTTFIIAHRPATLQQCGIRLHLEKGRLTLVPTPVAVA
jgi:ATP-binding cassette subfamily B protein